MISQVLALRGGVDIVIATPGRLLDLVEDRRALKLQNLKMLVLDDADVLLGLSLEPSVKRLLANPQMPPRPPLQLLFFSTTMPPEVRTPHAMAFPFCFVEMRVVAAEPGAVGEAVAGCACHCSCCSS